MRSSDWSSDVCSSDLNFVDQQGIGVQVRRHRERQTQVHAAGIPLYRRIDEIFYFSEIHDFVEAPLHVAPGHAQNDAVQLYIVAAAQFGMKSRADFQQRTRCPPETSSEERRVGKGG